MLGCRSAPHTAGTEVHSPGGRGSSASGGASLANKHDRPEGLLMAEETPNKYVFMCFYSVNQEIEM